MKVKYEERLKKAWETFTTQKEAFLKGKGIPIEEPMDEKAMEAFDHANFVYNMEAMVQQLIILNEQINMMSLIVADVHKLLDKSEIRPCPLALKEFKVGEILPDDFDDYKTMRTDNNYETSYLELTNGQRIKIDRNMKVLEILNG